MENCVDFHTKQKYNLKFNRILGMFENDVTSPNNGKNEM